MRQLESFFWGIIAALGALIFQLIIYIGFFSWTNLDIKTITFQQLFVIPQFILIGAFIEESFKYLIISKQIDTFSQNRFYIINSMFVGLGFFATEMLLANMSGDAIQTKFICEIAIVHLGSAGLIGYFVATKNPGKFLTFLTTVALVTFFHSIYNLLIIQRTFATNITIIFLLSLLVLLNIINFFNINSKLAQD